MAHVMLKTERMTETIAWYERAGFEVRDRSPDHGEPTWIEVARDDVVLQFLAGETPWPGTPVLTGTIYVHPPSVEAVHRQISEEIDAVWGPEVREWGTLELGLRDPNGYFLTFTEPAE